MAGAAGLHDPRDFLPYHFMTRKSDGQMAEGQEANPYLPEGFLLDDDGGDFGYRSRWNRAKAESFAAVPL